MAIVLTLSATPTNQNLLQIVQAVCQRVSLPAPMTAMSNQDTLVQQIIGFCNEEGQEQAARYQWQVLQNQATFTTVASQLQVQMATVAPGWKYIVNNTIWNRDLRRPVYGPRSQSDWQQMQAMQINGPFNSFRIIADAINFYPIPAVGQVCAFEYISKNWINTSAGPTSSYWTNDADIPVLSDQLLILGTIWRWKQAKGLNYAEDFAKYERQILDAMGRDAGKPQLDMTGAKDTILPGIFVPSGSWAV